MHNESSANGFPCYVGVMYGLASHATHVTRVACLSQTAVSFTLPLFPTLTPSCMYVPSSQPFLLWQSLAYQHLARGREAASQDTRKVLSGKRGTPAKRLRISAVQEKCRGVTLTSEQEGEWRQYHRKFEKDDLKHVASDEWWTIASLTQYTAKAGIFTGHNKKWQKERVPWFRL